jgi:hypothetical protein
LDKLAVLIKEDLANAEEAGKPYYIAAGEKLIEAMEGHFSQNPAAFWEWAERNFERTKHQLTIWMNMCRARLKGRTFETITEFQRSRGVEVPSGLKSAWRGYHEPVEKILKKVDAEALAQEQNRYREELEQIRKLAGQIIDIGYKTLATKLHPDNKKTGSKHAMTLLNAARERLRRHL